jgi:hypothetical protein
VIAAVLAALVVVVPVLVVTTVNMIGLGLLALALFGFGRVERLPVAGAGVVVVAGELESAWHGNSLVLQIAAAVSGLALLAAFELASWSQQLASTGADRGAYRAQLRILVGRLGIVACVLALLVVAARGLVGHQPALGIAGGLGAIGLVAGLIWLTARPGGTRT